MATQTPKRDDLHGEDNPKPRFGGNFEDGARIYDNDTNQLSGDSDPRDSYAARQQTQSGDPSDPRGTPSRGDLASREAEAGSGASGALDTTEQTLSDRLRGSQEKGGRGLYRHENSFGRFTSLKGQLTKFTRKRIATMAIVGLLGGGGLFGTSILSGPFQFVHFGQGLQQHFKANEDFGNDRTSKVLLYALSGKGAQNGRLGVTGNMAANRWEKRLLSETGLRPVYQEPGRRFVGFEIVDDNKAQDVLGQSGESSRKTRKLERSMGKGAEIQKAGDINGNNTTIVGSDGKPLGNKTRLINLSGVSFGDRRTWIKTIGSSTNVNNLSSSIGSRLLIKRAGVNFHPLNKFRGTIDNAAEERIRKKRADSIANGVESSDGMKTANTVDSDGDKKPDSADGIDTQTSEETKSIIDDFKKSGALKSGATSTAIIGVLCAAKTFGNGVEDYKFQNNFMPMVRMGFDGMASGNQVMSGDDIDLATMGVLVKYLYDKEKGTSWNQAESIRAEQGKDGGIPIAKEAELKNAGDKPDFFKVLDSIPMLGTTCNVVEGFFGLPIISQVSGVISGASEQALNAALSLGNSSVDELMLSALKTVSGKSVDPESKGAAYGNLANTGAFLAANDQAVATGGRPLNSDERSSLAMYQETGVEEERSTKSFASRYLDPYEGSSVVGSMIDSAPSSPAHAASMLSNPVKIIGSSISGLVSNFTPKAKASGQFDYGVRKFGFSLNEQRSEEFEDPYKNAAVVEPDLERLNDKYGKCFGMRVTFDETNPDDGVHIQSADKSVNVFKIYSEDKNSKNYDKDCDAEVNTSDKFNHYRFYLADAVTAVSLACYEGDDQACLEVGMGGGSSSDGASSGGSETGIDGLECPANLKSINVSGTTYYQMPIAPNGEYTFDPGATPAQRYGKKVLICTIFTVAKAYKAKYKDASTVKVGDLNASGHESHMWGIAVDINAKGSTAAADSLDGAYSKEATVEFGKMFIDTGKIKNIWWCPPDTSVQQLLAYAKHKNQNVTIQCVDGHEDHFHVDVDAPKGAVHTP